MPCPWLRYVVRKRSDGRWEGLCVGAAVGLPPGYAVLLGVSTTWREAFDQTELYARLAG